MKEDYNDVCKYSKNNSWLQFLVFLYLTQHQLCSKLKIPLYPKNKKRKGCRGTSVVAWSTNEGFVLTKTMFIHYFRHKDSNFMSLQHKILKGD